MFVKFESPDCGMVIGPDSYRDDYLV